MLAALRQPIADIGFRARAMSVGDCLDEAMRWYREHFALLMLLFGACLTPFAVLTYFMGGTPDNLPANALFILWQRQTGRAIAQPPVEYASWLPFIVLIKLATQTLASCAVASLVAATVQQRRVSTSAILVHGWTRMAAVNLAWLGVALACAAPAAALILGMARGVTSPTLAGPADATVAALFLVGSWLGAIPTLLIGPSIVTERIGAWASVQRSWRLTSGSWRRVAAIVVGAMAIGWIISAIPLLPIWLLDYVGYESQWHAPSQFLSATLGELLAAPVYPLAAVITYVDLRVRREGWDIDLMAGGARSDTPTLSPEPTELARSYPVHFPPYLVPPALLSPKQRRRRLRQRPTVTPENDA